MTGSHGDAPSPKARHSRTRWRWGTPVMFAVCGGLFAISYVNSDGTDLRPGRYTDLASLVQGDADSYQVLRQQAADLTDEVSTLGAAVADKQVRKVRRRVDRLRGPAGLEPASGAGVTVVLSDADRHDLEDAAARGDQDLNELLVHQQDIQGVVNAMWAGGATAVTIQGQRIVSTTGIKCTGNSVQLQGVPYPAPYTIQAVGDPAALEAALAADPRVEAFRDDAADPDVAVGYEERTEADVRAPAYDGLLDLTSAKPIAPAP